VNLARPPATPAGTFLLRCSLCAEHSDAQVDEILAKFEAAGRAVGILGQAAAAE
jgi:8-amino-7-oxononanoate synthase